MNIANLPQLLAGAGPVFLAGSGFTNIPTSTQSQLKTGAAVLSGITVNTIGTTSAIALYDGTSSAVTITIATPGVISWAAHPFVAGNAVKFYSTGALPTGLTAGTTYYVSTVGLAAGSFSVADTQAHALAGTNTVNTSGTQSGVQTAWNVTTPIGTYSTVGQASVPIGARLSNGLIALTTDGGGAADITVLFI